MGPGAHRPVAGSPGRRVGRSPDPLNRDETVRTTRGVLTGRNARAGPARRPCQRRPHAPTMQGMRTSTVADAASSPARDVGLSIQIERDDETSTWLPGELARDFPTVDGPVLAAALAEFADACLQLDVHALAPRLARELVRAADGTRPLARSAPSAS
jgi:hypothetical protein